MGSYNELIRKFDKVRDIMREFYIYGFKSRNDFTHISSRTYDNEKRRVESYLGSYMKWDYNKSGKKVFVSMNCSQIPTNPLYSSWKSKAFTDNDIVLHFYLLSVLSKEQELSLNDLTTKLCEASGLVFDTQTVRNKCAEYEKEGLVVITKQGKSLFYSLSTLNYDKLTNKVPNLQNAVKFFQGDTLFGEVGSFILDQSNKTNDTFLFKHYYIVHTLEDGVLLDLLSAIRNKQSIIFHNQNEYRTHNKDYYCVPLKIFISSTTGRRYLCAYKLSSKRFFNYRLDHIKSVTTLEPYKDFDPLQTKLEAIKDKIWGVGFGGSSRQEIITMKLFIDEKTEKHVIDRIHREGRGGTLTRLEENIYIFTVELFDTNDISPWIKTFMGRVIQLEGNNTHVINRFYNDIQRMKTMYELD